jgi:hypothetical protein
MSVIARLVIVLLSASLVAGRALAQTACAFDPTLFAQPVLSWQAVSASSRGIAIADYNGDALPDIAIHPFSSPIQFFFGLKDANNSWLGDFGVVADQYTLTAGGYGVVAADFNKDGFSDLFSCGLDRSLIRYSAIGRPLSTSTTSVIFTRTAHNAQAVDWDLDGVMDLALFGGQSPGVVLLRGALAPSAPGGFSLSTIGTLSQFSAYDGVVADLNRDGAQDLAVVDNFRTLRVYRGALDASGRPVLGSFPLVNDYVLPAATAVSDVAVADFDEDGALDIVLSTGANDVAVLRNRGGGEFEPPSLYGVQGASRQVLVVDVDRDGIQDIVVSHEGVSTKTILRGLGASGVGNGGFGEGTSFAGGGLFMATGDFDTNGAPDIVATSVAVSLLRGLCGRGTADLALSSSGAGRIEVSPLPTSAPPRGYPDGTTVTLTAIPQIGSQFLRWSGSISDTSRTVVWAAKGRAEVHASFLPLGFKLNAGIVGSGSLQNSVGRTTFFSGERVVLTAVPSLQQRFVRWTGDTTTTNAVLEIVFGERDVNVVANFEPIPQFALAVAIVGTGSVVKVPNQSMFLEGSSVTLTAQAGVDQRFLGWTGDTVATHPTLSYTFQGRGLSVTANFEPIPRYELVVATVGTGDVYRSSSQTSFLQGESVILSAIPGFEQRFIGWTGDTTASNATLQYTFWRRGLNVTANFEPTPRRRLSLSKIGQGSVSAYPSLDTYLEGTTVSVCAQNTVIGYEFERWSGDTASTSQCVAVRVGGRDISLTGHFVERSHPLSLQISGPGRVVRSLDLSSYPAGTQVRLSAVLELPEYYPYVRWRVCPSADFNSSACTEYANSLSLDLTMGRPQFVRASFEPHPRNPIIQSIRDVPGDQGGFVKVSWTRPQEVTCYYSPVQYWVFREVPPFRGAADLASGAARTIPEDGGLLPGRRYIMKTSAHGAGAYYWEYLDAVPDAGLSHMSFVAPTAGDSVGGDTAWTRFMVQHRDGRGCASNSPPDSGKSVDNVAPGVPQHFVGFEGAAANVLVWQPSSEADHGKYHLYRDASRDFVPSARNRIAVLSEARYDDPRVGNAWYKLTALDVHGNEGLPSVLEVRRTTSVEAAPMTFSARCVPNPSFGQTAFHVRLPVASTVSIDVLDASGRVVGRLGDRMFEPGPITLDWDGRGFDGRPVPGGLYFARVRAGRDEARIRFAVVR